LPNNLVHISFHHSLPLCPTVFLERGARKGFLGRKQKKRRTYADSGIAGGWQYVGLIQYLEDPRTAILRSYLK